MTNEVVLTLREADVTFTLERMEADGKRPEAFALRAEGQEYGAVIHQAGDTWRVRPVAPPPWFNDKRWRRSINLTMSLEQAAAHAAKHVQGLVDRMRFDDPMTPGDPAEEKLPIAMREKLEQLRALVAGARTARDGLQERLDQALYGSPAAGDSDTQVLPGAGQVRSMPADTTVRFVLPSGSLHARVLGAVLSVSAQKGEIVMVPVVANHITLSVQR